MACWAISDRRPGSSDDRASIMFGKVEQVSCGPLVSYTIFPAIPGRQYAIPRTAADPTVDSWIHGESEIGIPGSRVRMTPRLIQLGH